MLADATFFNYIGLLWEGIYILEDLTLQLQTVSRTEKGAKILGDTFSIKKIGCEVKFCSFNESLCKTLNCINSVHTPLCTIILDLSSHFEKIWFPCIDPMCTPINIGTSIRILLARRRHTVGSSLNLNSYVPH